MLVVPLPQLPAYLGVEMRQHQLNNSDNSVNFLQLVRLHVNAITQNFDSLRDE